MSAMKAEANAMNTEEAQSLKEAMRHKAYCPAKGTVMGGRSFAKAMKAKAAAPVKGATMEEIMKAVEDKMSDDVALLHKESAACTAMKAKACPAVPAKGASILATQANAAVPVKGAAMEEKMKAKAAAPVPVKGTAMEAMEAEVEAEALARVSSRLLLQVKPPPAGIFPEHLQAAAKAASAEADIKKAVFMKAMAAEKAAIAMAMAKGCQPPGW